MYLRDLKELLGKKDINMDLSNKSFPYSFKINENKWEKIVCLTAIKCVF